jgi:hypothetical protein
LDFLQKSLGGALLQHPRLRHYFEKLLIPLEIITKKPLFDCRMCGQCVLHSTGMVCPMTCPKSLRNGPCGGVRLDGSCEVYPDMDCVWVNSYTKSLILPWKDEFHNIRAPVDWSLQGSSSWVNYLTGRDQKSKNCTQTPTSGLDALSIDGEKSGG